MERHIRRNEARLENPPLIIEIIHDNNRTFKLIQDTYLAAGTKQRGLSFFKNLKNEGYNEVVTYGTVYGYGQVATAWCCEYVGLKCTIVVPKVRPRTSMTESAIYYKANIIEISPNKLESHINTNILSINADKYVKDNSAHKIKLLQLGLDDKNFIENLSENIMSVSHTINPKRIWIAAGSGVLARCLSRAFPLAKLCIVQVGRKIYPEVFEGINYKLYVSPEHFREDAAIQPPYISLRHYDAKIWKFVVDFGKDGDFIWNVK